MSDLNKIEIFLQKLAPCIQRGELEACVYEAKLLAQKIEIKAKELRDLSTQMGGEKKYDIAYVLALAAVQSLEESDRAMAYYNAGRAAQLIGKMDDKAEKLFKIAIDTDPNFARVHNNYALLLEKLDRKSEAEEHYKKAIELDPNDAWAHNNYALLLGKLDRKSEAEEHHKKAIESDPNDVWMRCNYANLLVELNRKSEAEEHYKKAIELVPNDAWMRSNYANLLVELNRKAEAEEHYKKAIELVPNGAWIQNNYANLLIALNRKAEAEEHYKKAVDADPKNAWIHNNFAILLAELAKLKEAEEHYKKAIDADPNFASAHANYAIILRENAQFYEAEKEVRIALQIEQKNPYALGILGNIIADEGFFEEAKIEYQKALDIISKNPFSMKSTALSGVHNNLGWVYVQLKQYNKAKEEFKNAIKSDKMNIKAIRNLRKLGKIVAEPEFSKTQIITGILILLSLFVSYGFFWIKRYSETVFTAQVTILISFLIFIFFYPQIEKVKISPTGIEFEKSSGRFAKVMDELKEAFEK